jgi:hypothetical protein
VCVNIIHNSKIGYLRENRFCTFPLLLDITIQQLCCVGARKVSNPKAIGFCVE